jgi:Lipocalin-like domain
MYTGAEIIQTGTAMENKIRNVAALFTLTFHTIGFFACSGPEKKDNNKMLAGMYKLHTIESQDSTGSWKKSGWANGGESYIVYDGLGHMAVQITPKGYRDFKWLTEEQALDEKILEEKIDSMPVAELRAAVTEFSSNYVYVANYTIDEGTDIITHHRLTSTVPAIWGTEVKRKFSFSGDTLTLINPVVSRRLIWIRQK